jgi:hypothetical protein
VLSRRSNQRLPDYQLLFRRVAWKRFEEAQLLHAEAMRLFTKNQPTKFTTGAVYLAGHAVECMLKAALVASYPATRREQVHAECKGEIGHDLDKLKRRLAQQRLHMHGDLVRKFSRVATWSTEKRYDPRETRVDDATAFLDAARAILRWAERLV